MSQQPQPQAQVNIAMQSVAGFNFNFAALIAIDLSAYVPGAPDRKATLLLLGQHTHVFEARRADEFYRWFLGMTGQSQIAQPGPVPVPDNLRGPQ